MGNVVPTVIDRCGVRNKCVTLSFFLLFNFGHLNVSDVGIVDVIIIVFHFRVFDADVPRPMIAVAVARSKVSVFRQQRRQVGPIGSRVVDEWE